MLPQFEGFWICSPFSRFSIHFSTANWGSLEGAKRNHLALPHFGGFLNLFPILQLSYTFLHCKLGKSERAVNHCAKQRWIRKLGVAMTYLISDYCFFPKLLVSTSQQSNNLGSSLFNCFQCFPSLQDSEFVPHFDAFMKLPQFAGVWTFSPICCFSMHFCTANWGSQEETKSSLQYTDVF